MLAISLGFMILAYSEIGATAKWKIWFFWALGVCGLLITIDMKFSYLKLTKKHMIYHSDFKNQSYKKSLIKKVTWQKGCGVSIQLNNDEWKDIPSFNQNSQSMTNSIRAWLKKQ